MSGAILVTGATGTVGAAVRDVERARRALGDGVACVPFDFERPATAADAFRGIRRVFLVRPPRTLREFVEDYREAWS
jgi:uncharacterized protein YbjT (DUF2867 family)